MEKILSKNLKLNAFLFFAPKNSGFFFPHWTLPKIHRAIYRIAKGCATALHENLIGFKSFLIIFLEIARNFKEIEDGKRKQDSDSFG